MRLADIAEQIAPQCRWVSSNLVEDLNRTKRLILPQINGNFSCLTNGIGTLVDFPAFRLELKQWLFLRFQPAGFWTDYTTGVSGFLLTDNRSCDCSASIVA